VGRVQAGHGAVRFVTAGRARHVRALYGKVRQVRRDKVGHGEVRQAWRGLLWNGAVRRGKV
jgi:hypothetical protein